MGWIHESDYITPVIVILCGKREIILGAWPCFKIGFSLAVCYKANEMDALIPASLECSKHPCCQYCTTATWLELGWPLEGHFLAVASKKVGAFVLQIQGNGSNQLPPALEEAPEPIPVIDRNCEIITLCCFKLISLWELGTWHEKNNTKRYKGEYDRLPAIEEFTF